MATALERAVPVLLILGGLVALVAASQSAPPNGGDGGGNGGGAPIPGPNEPVLQGGDVVLTGFRTNPYGVMVTFRVEYVAAAADDPQGAYYGIIFQPWAGNAPVVVAQAHTQQDARMAVLAVVDADQHGSPG